MLKPQLCPGHAAPTQCAETPAYRERGRRRGDCKQLLPWNCPADATDRVAQHPHSTVVTTATLITTRGMLPVVHVATVHVR